LAFLAVDPYCRRSGCRNLRPDRGNEKQDNVEKVLHDGVEGGEEKRGIDNVWVDMETGLLRTMR
jgi:hypothetical protein